jgi:hypothetical protein
MTPDPNTPDPNRPNTFEEVFSAELEEIAKRQGKPDGAAVDRKSLAGIALSGGGIRSATTALGVLQALRKMGILPAFDYLSTVSGGGFAGSWWTAWASRPFDRAATQDEKFFPPPEQTQPERDRTLGLSTLNESRSASDRPSNSASNSPSDSASNSASDKEARRKAADPVHHLRLFSNYLTPVKGALAADTWRATAVITRNLFLTWVVLLPMLFAAVLVAQSYFTVAPLSETEYLYPYSHFAADSVATRQLDSEMAVLQRLDGLVHGETGIVALEPVKELHALGEKSMPESRFVSNPLDAIARDLSNIQPVDSAVAQDIGASYMVPGLDSDLSMTERSLISWHDSDSVARLASIASLPMKAAKGTDNGVAHHAAEHLDSISRAFQHTLDPKVDSIRTALAALDRQILAHRERQRESWLFDSIHRGYLAKRAVWASFPTVLMLGWIALLICLWMINSSNKLFGGNVLQGSYAFLCGLVAFNGLNWLIPYALGTEELGSMGQIVLQLLWAAGALFLINIVLWDRAHWLWKKNRKALTPDVQEELVKLLEVRRARIVTYHQRLLMGAVLSAVLLLFGGFGHEVINYLFLYDSGHQWDIWQNTSRLAAIAAILTALTGTGLAARISAPNTNRGTKPQGKLKSIAIALAPPLIVLLLMCLVSWGTHWIMQDLVFRQSTAKNQHYITLIFAMWMLGFLTLYYAVYDLHFRKNKTSASGPIKQFSRALLVFVLVAQLGIMMTAVVYPTVRFMFPIWSLALPAAAWALVTWKYWQERKPGQPTDRRADDATTQTPVAPPRRAWMRNLISGSASSMLILLFSTVLLLLISAFVHFAVLPIDHLFIVALGATLVLFAIDLAFGVRTPEPGRRGNHEARVLLAINVTTYTLFLVIPPLKADAHWGVTHVLEILIALSLDLVIFVGWRVDPNALSIHTFYKNRIVRAYLGASNWLRNRSSVSEAHPEDDIPLAKMTTCENGAPYHLINTTLNLLGTKSLEAAQRHASNFIFSKRFCGSVTTGYRPTDRYMSSTMTLGTAVAISGAAASPNMGSNQVSGATTMLMSLMNVRLGYWAANPGRRRWREAQPKLWPYYLLKESLSKTSGFGAFCYLTDGGHFDNTGLYALIERACHSIVLCDNGADPSAHFKDLGNALRRARIDFGVEFDLDGLKEMTSLAAPGSGSHFLRGTVRYAEEHVRTLWGANWDDGLSQEARKKCLEGTILILKPSLLGDEPADVLQYGLEYADFPQQSTADQWFSEDQFESYRRLGFWSAQKAFAKPDYRGVTREELLDAIKSVPKGSIPVPTPASSTTPSLAFGAEHTPVIALTERTE